MPRAKKVIVKDVNPVEVVVHTATGAVGDADVIAEWGDEVQPVTKPDIYQLAALAATQLTVTPHDSNEIIDLRIDRALFIAGKLLSKAKEIK